MIIVALDLLHLCNATFFQFFDHNRSKFILNPMIIHFASRRYDSRFFLLVRKNPENRFFSCHFTGLLHLFFFDHKRNDPCSCNLISGFHRKISMSGCDHHLTKTVHCIQLFGIDLQYPFTVGDQFDLSFLHPGRMHMLTLTDLTQNLSCLIFMKHTFLFFPDIKILFSHR